MNYITKKGVQSGLVLSFFIMLGCMPRVDNSTIQAALYFCDSRGGLQYIGMDSVRCVDTTIRGKKSVYLEYREHVKLKGEVYDMAGN